MSDEPAPEPEQAPQEAAATAQAAVPSADEVRRMIAELASLRDYDRLRWILVGIEGQVAPMRAELLKVLDDQVQKLFQAEVELRTASALASIPVEAMGLSRPAASIGEGKDASTSSASREAEGTAWVSKRPDDVPVYAADDVLQEIDAAQFAKDPDELRAQMSALHLKITHVEDPKERLELIKRLQERRQEAFLAEVEARKAELEQRFAQPAAPPSTTSAKP